MTKSKRSDEGHVGPSPGDLLVAKPGGEVGPAAQGDTPVGVALPRPEQQSLSEYLDGYQFHTYGSASLSELSAQVPLKLAELLGDRSDTTPVNDPAPKDELFSLDFEEA